MNGRGAMASYYRSFHRQATTFPLKRARRLNPAVRFQSSNTRSGYSDIPSHCTIHKRGDHPYGSREYLLCRSIEHADATEAKDGNDLPTVVLGQQADSQLLHVLATLKAHRNIVFGASTNLSTYTPAQLCRPLLAPALVDCSTMGFQPQALSTLHGLCDWVVDCLEKQDEEETHSASKILGTLDEKSLAAVRAIATQVPRPGHTVVGRGTHEDAATGWEALAKEFVMSGLSAECELYRKNNGELTGIELLADTQEAYVRSAGGSMAQFFFMIEYEKEEVSY